MGLATSFYNDKDDTIAEALVMTLLETRQTIPDFLEAYIPEGYADGTGDIAALHFDAVSLRNPLVIYTNTSTGL